MQVLVDGKVFENGSQIGIWRIFYEVLQRVGTEAGATLWLRGRQVQSSPAGLRVYRDSARANVPRWDVVGRLNRRWSNVGSLPPSVRHATLFHSTFYTPSPASDLASVVTVYDMLNEKLLYLLPAGKGLDEKRAAIKAATLCICISAATARDLVQFYPEVAGRVRVVHLGAEHLAQRTNAQGANASLRADRGASRGGDEFALFVGSRMAYKNFGLVLDAMTHSAWPSHISLRVVGAPPSSGEEALSAALGLGSRVRFLGPLDDAALGREYQRANCFIFPSTHEGFGIPLLEAQVNGAPVVCSDIPVFHEVAGTAPLFFDPRLHERLAETVAALQEGGARRRCIEAGHENVARFSWDRAASETLSVYREAARLGPVYRGASP